MLINIFLLSCCVGYAAVCICQGREVLVFIEMGIPILFAEAVFLISTLVWMGFCMCMQQPHVTMAACPCTTPAYMACMQGHRWTLECPVSERQHGARPPQMALMIKTFWAWLGFENAGTQKKNQWVQLDGVTSVMGKLSDSSSVSIHFSRAAGRLGSGIGWERLHNWPESQECFLVGRPSKKRWDPLLSGCAVFQPP